MSIVLIKVPQTQVAEQPSKWSAVHHPIEFHLQRKDQTFIANFFTEADDTTTFIMHLPIPDTVAVGQTITLFSNQFQLGDVNQQQSRATAKIISIDGNAIKTDLTKAFPLSVGYVLYPDAFKNYFVIADILGVDDSNNYKLIGSVSSKSDINGVIKIHVQKWIKSQAIFENEFLYDVINKAMRGEGAKFNVEYRESFNGDILPKENINSLYFWANSAKQIQDIYGSNMGDFVPTIDGTRTNKAKFQSVFDKPTYFPGYPHSMSFIYSDNLENLQLIRHERQLDINGNLVGSETMDDIDHSQREFSNRLMMAQGYSSSIKEVELWIEAEGEISVPTIDLGFYVEEDVFEPTPVKNPFPSKAFLQ